MKINNLNIGCTLQPSLETDRINELVTIHASEAAKIAKASKLDFNEALSVCLDAMWSAAKKFDPSRGEFIIYARSFMRRRLTDLYRKLYLLKRSQTILYDTDVMHCVCDTTLCETFAFPELHSALAQLPEKQREHITKVYLKGYTREDVSREYGVSRQASCSMINRGIAKLKKILITQPENN